MMMSRLLCCAVLMDGNPAHPTTGQHDLRRPQELNVATRNARLCCTFVLTIYRRPQLLYATVLVMMRSQGGSKTAGKGSQPHIGRLLDW